MRSLRLVVVVRSGAVPALVAVALSPACGARTELRDQPPQAAGAGGASAGSGGSAQAGKGGAGGAGGAGEAGAGGQGEGGTFVLGGSGGAAGFSGMSAALCHGAFQVEKEYTVPLPPEGVPAQPGQICSVSVEPVESNRAARVTVTKLASPNSIKEASGFCAIDPALAPFVVGLPVIEVVEATHDLLLSMKFTELVGQPGGYAFKATLPQDIFVESGLARMTVRTTLNVACSDEGTPVVVHATTDVHLCSGDDALMWVSSGDLCTVCRIIAEMAPSPIVPDGGSGALPLSRVLRLRLVEVARVSGTVVLWAENDGGEGLDYRWQALGGRLEQLAPDVVAWTVEQGEEAALVQVAAWGPASAAVASFAFNLDGGAMQRAEREALAVFAPEAAS